MKGKTLLTTFFVFVLLVSIVTPGALAEEIEAGFPGQETEPLPPNVAIGYVYVTVLPWKPDLEGLGSGLFTYSGFDFEEFFSELAESLSSLLGL